MLNIGKLSPGATEYYVGEVASSAEDYYTGRGEQPGRWVGSLAVELGLSGEVDPDQFRRVLSGQHPHGGAFLTTAQGSAARAAVHHDRVPDRGELPELVNTFRAAAHLGVSVRYVRQLLVEGDRYRADLANGRTQSRSGFRRRISWVSRRLVMGRRGATRGRSAVTSWNASRARVGRCWHGRGMT